MKIQIPNNKFGEFSKTIESYPDGENFKIEHSKIDFDYSKNKNSKVLITLYEKDNKELKKYISDEHFLK